MEPSLILSDKDRDERRERQTRLAAPGGADVRRRRDEPHVDPLHDGLAPKRGDNFSLGLPENLNEVGWRRAPPPLEQGRRRLRLGGRRRHAVRRVLWPCRRRSQFAGPLKTAFRRLPATLIPGDRRLLPIFIRHTATKPVFIGVSGIFGPQQIRNLWRVKILAFPFDFPYLWRCGGLKGRMPEDIV